MDTTESNGLDVYRKLAVSVIGMALHDYRVARHALRRGTERKPQSNVRERASTVIKETTAFLGSRWADELACGLDLALVFRRVVEAEDERDRLYAARVPIKRPREQFVKAILAGVDDR